MITPCGRQCVFLAYTVLPVSYPSGRPGLMNVRPGVVTKLDLGATALETLEKWRATLWNPNIIYMTYRRVKITGFFLLLSWSEGKRG